MGPESHPRRDVLRWLSLGFTGVAAGGTLTAGPARAFQVLPASDYAEALKTACAAADASHRAQLEAARQRLGVTLTEAERELALAALRCPSCGCPLATLSAADSPLAPIPPER